MAVNTRESSGFKILVTGSNGQLGSELRSIASEHPHINFIFTDVEELDITNSNDLSAFFSKNKPNFVINCAAYTAVDGAEDDEKGALLLNFEAPKLVAKISKETGAKLIHISTDYVFDGKAWTPYKEDFPTSPNSVYGRSKLLGEQAVLESGVAMVVRTSWLYSAYGNNFMKTIVRKGTELRSLRVVFDQVGSPTWANDLATALVEIVLKSSKEFAPEIFHYSNEGVCSWYDFAYEIITQQGIDCKVSPVLSSEYPTKATRPPFSVLDKTKIKSRFGIHIPQWKDSLHECLKEFSKQ